MDKHHRVARSLLFRCPQTLKLPWSTIGAYLEAIGAYGLWGPSASSRVGALRPHLRRQTWTSKLHEKQLLRPRQVPKAIINLGWGIGPLHSLERKCMKPLIYSEPQLPNVNLRTKPPWASAHGLHWGLSKIR